MPSLTISQKVGQLFFIGIPGPEIDEITRDLLERIQPGGVCLFSRNIRERAQTRELLDALRATLPVRPFLSVDQEGGLVDRLRRIMTAMPAADKIATADEAAQLAAIIAESLRVLGFNMNFAPVVDVINEDRGKSSNGLHSRAFGRSSDEVTKLATAFLTTMQNDGIIGCLKHFPGLGASEVDSHKELPTVSISEEEFRETDLHPYKSLLASGTAKSVMVAHAAFPNVGLQEVDQNGKLLPSSLSPAIITKLLRGEFGYDGLVVTDDLEMGAIIENYGIGEASKMAITAGSDMVAICASPAAIDEGFDSVKRAVESGEIAEGRIDESLARIATLKETVAEPLAFDNERLNALSDRIDKLNDMLK